MFELVDGMGGKTEAVMLELEEKERRACYKEETVRFEGEVTERGWGNRSKSMVSNITLAMLEDTGWYEVNYEKTDNLLWGLGQGCSFVRDACPTNECVVPPDEEQSLQDVAACTFDRTAIGFCGQDRLMDGCSTILPYLDQRCSVDEDDVRVRYK